MKMHEILETKNQIARCAVQFAVHPQRSKNWRKRKK